MPRRALASRSRMAAAAGRAGLRRRAGRILDPVGALTVCHLQVGACRPAPRRTPDAVRSLRDLGGDLALRTFEAAPDWADTLVHGGRRYVVPLLRYMVPLAR